MQAQIFIFLKSNFGCVFFFVCVHLKMQRFFYRESLIFFCFLKKLVNLLVSMKINCKISSQLILLFTNDLVSKKKISEYHFLPIHFRFIYCFKRQTYFNRIPSLHITIQKRHTTYCQVSFFP